MLTQGSEGKGNLVVYHQSHGTEMLHHQSKTHDSTESETYLLPLHTEMKVDMNGN